MTTAPVRKQTNINNPPPVYELKPLLSFRVAFFSLAVRGEFISSVSAHPPVAAKGVVSGDAAAAAFDAAFLCRGRFVF